MWSALRPAERVFVGYVLWALLHMALTGRIHVRFGLLPGPDLLLVLASIVTFRLFAERVRQPLAPALRRAHLLLAVPLVLPALALGSLAFRERVGDYGDPTATSSWLLFLREQASRLGLAIVLPLFAWLVMGRRLRAAGSLGEGLAPVPILREATRVVGAAARDWLALVLTIYAYASTESAEPLFPDADGALRACDRFLFVGHDPTLLLEQVIHPALSEWMAFCYVFYVFLFPLAMGVVYALEPKRFPWFAFAVTATLALGYVGYALVPAQGPLFTMHYGRSLDLWYLAPVKDQLMDRMRVPRDCFPSLHTAASLTLLRGLYRTAPRLALVLAPIVLTIPLACVYLRYHWVTDVLAGIALFALVAFVQGRLERRATLPSA